MSVAASPEPGALEPIERASRDELQALQLERLQWTLRHAYDNVPHYRQSFDAAGVHPDDFRALEKVGDRAFEFLQRKLNGQSREVGSRASRSGKTRRTLAWTQAAPAPAQ